MINRREFLVESLVAGAGLSLLPALVADAQSDPLIFDLHAHPGTFYNKGRQDRNFDLGRLSIRRDHRPHEHRLAGGGVPADSFVRLEGRGNGGHRGGSDAGGGQSVAPVGPPPTPKVPAWGRGVRAELR